MASKKPRSAKNRELENPAEQPAKPDPGDAGQAGDTQGLSDLAEADSESVRELIQEGQFYEAAVISGVENAPDADAGEIRTHEVPQDDVPLEYLPSDEVKE